MIFNKVEIVRRTTTSAKQGVFSPIEESQGYAYMTVQTVRSNVAFNYSLREQDVSHEGWARRTSKWNEVEINDIIVYKGRRLQVVEIHDEGELGSPYLHFVLNEQSLVEA